MICFPLGQPPGHPQGTLRNLVGMVQLWYFFYHRGGEELLRFEKDFAGPPGHTHGTCSSPGPRFIALD